MLLGDHRNKPKISDIIQTNKSCVGWKKSFMYYSLVWLCHLYLLSKSVLIKH